MDLIEARVPIELTSVRLAATNATEEQLAAMHSLLEQAAANIDEEDAILSRVNMLFRREIASASGNSVLAQLLEVLTDVFKDEQRAILRIFGSRQQDYDEHIEIYQALVDGDAELAVDLMRAHLECVRDVLLVGIRRPVPPRRPGPRQSLAPRHVPAPHERRLTAGLMVRRKA